MSTRCTITFVDSQDGTRYHIYQHMDGYPEGEHGVVAAIKGAMTSGKAWEMPRFEADEFAAAYIATHKTAGGNIRLCNSPERIGDLSYKYVVKQVPGGLSVEWTDGRKKRSELVAFVEEAA